MITFITTIIKTVSDLYKIFNYFVANNKIILKI